MLLTKDEDGELCLIGNASLTWYSGHKPIKVLKDDLPVELKRTKGSYKIKDILRKQKQILENHQEEVNLRKKLIGILENLSSKYDK